MENKEALEEMEKALVETYELNASLRKEIEILEANLKHLNINYKTVLKVNNDLLNENRKLKEEYYDLEGELANTHYKMVRYKKTIKIMIREKINPSAVLATLQNYKYHNKVDIPYEKVSIYLDCELTQEDYELLKEVLGNDTSNNIK